MAIAITLQSYLQHNAVPYDVLHHSYSHTSLGTARAANIPQSQFAKPVILRDREGYLMAVVPSSSKIQFSELNRQMHRDLRLADEGEIAELFADCDLGAIPPIGEAYKMDMVVDESLDDCEDIYFEAGNHMDVIHLRQAQFQQLAANADHLHFSENMWLE